MIFLSLILLTPILIFSMDNGIQPGDLELPQAALARLSGAIKIPTISYKADQPEKQAQFHQTILQFHSYLESSFPKVHRHLTKEVVNSYSLLYRWQGQNIELKPALLMSHMDVVPVDEDPAQSWVKDPFSGETDNEFIYGRGTIDIKTTLIAMLQVIEELLDDDNYKPKRTYYLAFGHDEEIGGREGNAKISEYLRTQKNVQLDIVVDEGGAVLTNFLEGVTIPIALVGVCEKGYLSVELSVQGQGGHASMPPIQTIPGILAQAICTIEANPMPTILSVPTKMTLESLAPHLDFGKQLIMGNLWLTSGLVKKLFTKKETSNAIVRTTIAPTIMQSGYKDNVLPSSGRVVLNCRLLPENSKASVLSYIQNTLNDPRITVKELDGGWEASPVSDIQSGSFKFLTQIIQVVFPHVAVVPNLVVGGTDARYYAGLTNNIFRFAPLKLDKSDLSLMHGINERLSLVNVAAAIKFYKEFIMNF